MRQAILLVAASVFASAAAAEDVRLCGGGPSPVAADGRLLNHYPYPVAPRQDLVRSPVSSERCQALHRFMLADLQALLASARGDPEVGDAIVAISCFRSLHHQSRIFCRHGRSLVAQAYQVAPPGYSEHATGLAIDFGDRRSRGCNLERCFAQTAVGRWLARNGPGFGFELSFPEGNAQGVAFEPWHWRWVGRGGDGQSRQAQAVFAAARASFPAAGPSQSIPGRQTVSRTVAPSDPPAGSLSRAEE